MRFPATALTTMAATVLAAAPVAAQDAGKTAYDNRCARCHTVEKAVEFLRAHPDPADRAAWLEKKLSRHHARNAEDRAKIISFLEQRLKEME